MLLRLRSPRFGPVLFVVFIDDNDVNIRSTVLKFADDTKLISGQGWNAGQGGAERESNYFAWMVSGLANVIYLDKCAVTGMHFGFNNIEENVELGGIKRHWCHIPVKEIFELLCRVI